MIAMAFLLGAASVGPGATHQDNQPRRRMRAEPVKQRKAVPKVPESRDSKSREPEKQEEPKPKAIFVKPNYLQHLQKLGPIPKRVHVFFPVSDFAKHHELSMVQHGIGNLVHQNPDWIVQIYDEHEMDKVIADAGDLIPPEEEQLLLGKSNTNGDAQAAAHFAEKADLARLIVMYKYGGLYVNFDRRINIPLNQVFGGDNPQERTARLCLPTFQDINFMQSVMCSAPQNRLFKEAITRSTDLRLHGGNQHGQEKKPLERRGGWIHKNELYALGPLVYNEAVANVVFDGSISLSPKDNHSKEQTKQHLALARAALEETNGVIVTALDAGCNSLLSREEDTGTSGGSGCPSMNKKELHDAFHMKPWGQEIQERWDDQLFAQK
eukprot:CAMPEP_0172452130 /NCGR_PEP_ID=MMETSP1065-20121228/9884_1 /TAXON_ID=265537 /ORGANISM="Amphiprora paludosa, Strain CCMP125" /LENGTH=379 /DNA_ID=CAMNT_0013204139 /DNA_START=36 /DNA_END=1175 /DNA_ORIENTATION=+